MDLIEFANQAWNARAAIGNGVLMTVVISGLAILFGSVLGTAVGVVLTYGNWIVRLPARLYADIVRGTPVLVLILAAFYVSSVVELDLTATQAGVLALTLFCGSHVSEIVRGALQAIPKGQIDAAKSIGLTFWETFFSVLLPQALRQIVPTWINAAVEIVKGSTLLSIIGVTELLQATQQIIGRTFMTVEFYILAGAIYFLIDFSIERLGKYVDKRLSFN